MKDKKRDRMHEEASAPVEASECNISILQAIMVHAICGLGLATGLWISHHWHSINLVSHPSDTIFLIWVVPVASVYGSSWADWQRLLACTKPIGSLEYMLCIPAHGAVIGAWLGAWPMPLDWERPWQEWPICVTYGSLVGYVVGMVASVVMVLASSTGAKRRRLKGD
ncbi:PIGF/3-ketodihydrosphingosine reductase fusion protein [Linum perenne]